MMNKHYLQTQIKSTGTAYLLYFLLFGTHYAYLGKWGWQILYWITLGGLGVWLIIDLFTIPGKVNRYNAKIIQQIEALENKEKQKEYERQQAMFSNSGNS